MTLEELVGATLVVGLPGTRMTPEVADHLRAIHAGGFIPFARNFESPDQFRALVDDVNEAAGRRLLVMVDHEGGRVVRFARGVTPFPDALTVGSSQSAEDVYRQGTIEAAELSALGVHMNLAPVVDVLVAGADPIIGTRSYGGDPARVAELGAARIRGLQAHRVAACAKHFPGLGAVPKDPHIHLPTVEGLGWPSLRAVHLVPFAAAITAGVAAVMSSHVCYPALEGAPGVPATFSSRLMRDLLRDELGFEGLLLSDDLEMGALRELDSPARHGVPGRAIGQAAVRAAAVGHDLLLVCSDLAAQREVFDALREAYCAGRLPTAALARSVERAERLRQQFCLTQP